ncbi:MAG: DUF2163 domain-containing protein, partial [Paracoccaceae bacterium]
TQVDGTFRVELRGLTDPLNQPQGRTYQRSCSAILGDRKCGIDLTAAAYSFEAEVQEEANMTFVFPLVDGFAERWFERGTLEVLSGAAVGLKAIVKADRLEGSGRMIVLWEGLAVAVQPGDMVRVSAGCDRLVATCKSKFNNINNFRGFPHIPGEDWLASYPVSSTANTGGSRNQGAS